jgi:anaerobic selenocysteine-containing dehydrogenase
MNKKTMSEHISRRDFIKLAGITGATAAVLTGCGPASRYVVREPYTKMPEYTYNGQSTYYATTCRECSAGCGLVVRTMQGRALKVEGNKYHPVNEGKTCARGQAALHGLYNPDRIQGPADKNGNVLDWDAAIGVVADSLGKYQPDEIAFLTGLAPDHLFDLFGEVAKAFGAPAPLRYGAL